MTGMTPIVHDQYFLYICLSKYRGTMSLSNTKSVILIFLILSVTFSMKAQQKVSAFFDMGKNNVSNGFYLKNGIGGSLMVHSYKVSAYTQLSYISNNPRFLSAIHASVFKELLINEYPVETDIYFILNRFSENLYSSDWGMWVSKNFGRHYYLSLGANFKTYAVNSSARKEYNFDKSDAKIHEDFTLIFRTGFSLKPEDNYWNAAFYITNMDFFLINQSTNPMFLLNAEYSATPKLKVFVDAWYKTAGLFNISTDKFGYFFRTGIVWEI